MKDDDLIFTNIDDAVIDLGDCGAAQEVFTLNSGSTDTITISGIDYSAMSTISIPSSMYSTTYNSNWNNTTWNGATVGGTYTTGVPSSSTVNITGTGIDMAAGTDIKLDGKSLKEFMTKMEQRLAILVPDPAKLEKFEALKKAYEHYKTMESLCFNEPEETK